MFKEILQKSQTESDDLILLKGEEVFLILEDKNFLKKWKDLLDLSYPNASIFQSPEFVKSWYLCQKNHFVPIIIYLFENQNINGLLFLAYSEESKHASKRILGAGEYDAEYQCWITKPGLESVFLENSIKLLFNTFPKSNLIFRFLQHDTLLKKIRENKNLVKKVAVQTLDRPLVVYDSEGYLKLIKKRHFKAKVNRMNRSGKVELKEIKEINDFKRLYPQIMSLYDFRQGALFNKIPSENYSCDYPLFIRLFEEKIIHVSILFIDNEIASCIIGYCSGDWFHLAGLITYSPFYSKNSPGLVHLFLLIQKVKELNITIFDLTAGYDGYKELFKTTTDEVHEVTFCDSRINLFRRKLKISLNQILLKKGIRPMDFELKLKKKRRIWKSKIQFILTSPLVFFRKKTIDLEKVSIQKNNITSLLKFQTTGFQTRWEFLSDSFKNVEAGFEFSTLTHENKLIAVFWTTSSGKKDMTDEIISKELIVPKTYWNNLVSNKAELEKKLKKIDF